MTPERRTVLPVVVACWLTFAAAFGGAYTVAVFSDTGGVDATVDVSGLPVVDPVVVPPGPPTVAGAVTPGNGSGNASIVSTTGNAGDDEPGQPSASSSGGASAGGSSDR